MSAEVLREAAVLMRARAETAMPGRWFVYETFTHQCIGVFTRWGKRRQVGQASEAHPGSAAHIAAWHPAVTLAVADWLEVTADQRDAKNLTEGMFASALAVARAYLGSDQ